MDADSYCLRNLRELQVKGFTGLLCSTERHRRDRRTLGCVLLKAQGWWPAPTRLKDFHRWCREMSRPGTGSLCLVTNNLLFARCGHELLKRLAQEMRVALERSARGREAKISTFARKQYVYRSDIRR